MAVFCGSAAALPVQGSSSPSLEPRPSPGSAGSEQNSSPWMKWRWAGRTGACKRSPSQGSRSLRLPLNSSDEDDDGSKNARASKNQDVPPRDIPTARLRDRSAMPGEHSAADGPREHSASRAVATGKQVEALENRVMTLLSGVRQQSAADKQEADCLGVLAATRSDARHSAQELRHEGLERRVADLSSALQGFDIERVGAAKKFAELEELARGIQTSIGHPEVDLQRRLEDMEQEYRSLGSSRHTVAACKKDVQERLRPIEDRIRQLEDHGQKVDLGLVEDRLRSLEDSSQQVDVRPIQDRLLSLEDRSQKVDLRPIEDRLRALEDRSVDVAPTRASAHYSELRGVLPQELQKLEAMLLEELRVIHSRCSHVQHVVDDSVIEALRDLKRRVDEFDVRERQQHARQALAAQDGVPERDARGVLREGFGCVVSLSEEGLARPISGDLSRGFTSPGSRTAPPSTCESGRVTSVWSTPESQQYVDRRRISDSDESWGLEARIVLCERAEDEMRQHFAQRSSQLARSVQSGFTDVREHLDKVVNQLGQLSERVRQREETAGATVAHGIVVLNERLGCLEVQSHGQAHLMEVIRKGLKSVQGFLSEVKGSIDVLVSDRIANATIPSLSLSSLHSRLVVAEEQLVAFTEKPFASRAELEERFAHLLSAIDVERESGATAQAQLLDLPAQLDDSRVQVLAVCAADFGEPIAALTRPQLEIDLRHVPSQMFEGAGPMRQAEELLCMAADIVERQQRELSQLMNALDVRGLDVKCDDSDPESSSTNERTTRPFLDEDDARSPGSCSASATTLPRPLTFVPGPDAGSGTPGTKASCGVVHLPYLEDEDFLPSPHT